MKKLLCFLLCCGSCFAQPEIFLDQNVKIRMLKVVESELIGDADEFLARNSVNQTVGFMTRSRAYSGVSNASGDVTITFLKSFNNVPAVLPLIPNQTNIYERCIVTEVTTTGCKIRVLSTPLLNIAGVIVLGQLTAVSGRAVDVVVISK